MIVRAYLKVNVTHEFPVRSKEHAREIAARISREGLWVVYGDGREEMYPITEIFKVAILPEEGDES